MKTFALAFALISSAVPAFAAPRPTNISPRHARQLHFARGATVLRVRDFLSGSERHFYTLKTRAGQKLTIRATSLFKNPDAALVPMIFVTPPCGHFDGEKTAIYTTRSSRAGVYRIEVAANQMASTARSGPFQLKISAR